ncbi:hypothetical protein AXG93_4123s1270 [Marchantia polymorpha subsp. ruderalis]|uniref:Uncharacterized protein n=1 Tax=Marchantia polymorpha subsp. ruderalis TaxID=1480154 RepID=A0A176WM48_MARPO|nr:hypothetical protein AXG93_4123s1270 [Marchantia polymorpha subsp. ruderalis]
MTERSHDSGPAFQLRFLAEGEETSGVGPAGGSGGASGAAAVAPAPAPAPGAAGAPPFSNDALGTPAGAAAPPFSDALDPVSAPVLGPDDDPLDDAIPFRLPPANGHSAHASLSSSQQIATLCQYPRGLKSCPDSRFSLGSLRRFIHLIRKNSPMATYLRFDSVRIEDPLPSKNSFESKFGRLNPLVRKIHQSQWTSVAFVEADLLTTEVERCEGLALVRYVRNNSMHPTATGSDGLDEFVRFNAGSEDEGVDWKACSIVPHAASQLVEEF